MKAFARSALSMLALALALAACESLPAARTDTANTAFIRTCIDKLNARDIDGWIACWAPFPGYDGLVVPRDDVRRTTEDILRTFPDFHWEIIDMLQDGNKVVIRSLHIGTHEGTAQTAFAAGALLNVAPTHKLMGIDVIHWFWLRDGHIVSQVSTRDDLTLLRQLGLSPPPARLPRPRRP